MLICEIKLVVAVAVVVVRAFALHFTSYLSIALSKICPIQKQKTLRNFGILEKQLLLFI